MLREIHQRRVEKMKEKDEIEKRRGKQLEEEEKRTDRLDSVSSIDIFGLAS
jgi:hypothetical protein